MLMSLHCNSNGVQTLKICVEQSTQSLPKRRRTSKAQCCQENKAGTFENVVEVKCKCHRLWHILYKTHGELLWGRREVAVWSESK